MADRVTPTERLRLGYLASGAASSARGIHDAAGSGGLAVTSAVVISNNSDSAALRWARGADLPAVHLSGRTHPDPVALDTAVRDCLDAHEVDLVILSGYAKLVGPHTVARFESRILNVHPAPLPEFGGRGMYGLAVHEAVLASGRSDTAVTIHLVDERYDEGAAVASYPIEVRPDDTPDSLRDRVRAAEPACWVDVLTRLTRGEPLLDVGPGRG